MSYFFAGIGVFYGLALGLIAVGTWENYTQTDGVVSTEAAALASLYRDLDGYPQPMRGRLEAMMRDYTQLVIEKEWPAHKKGQALEDGDAKLDQFEDEVLSFEPAKEREKIIQGEVLRSIDTVQEQRRLRLQAVPSGLPAALWSVVIVGALLNVILTYLFWVRQPQDARNPRRNAGDLHRPAGLPDRGDGQPLPRRVQHLVRGVPGRPEERDEPRQGVARLPQARRLEPVSLC